MAHFLNASMYHQQSNVRFALTIEWLYNIFPAKTEVKGEAKSKAQRNSEAAKGEAKVEDDERDPDERLKSGKTSFLFLSWPVQPDFAKFRHFGNILKLFGIC